MNGKSLYSSTVNDCAPCLYQFHFALQQLTEGCKVLYLKSTPEIVYASRQNWNARRSAFFFKKNTAKKVCTPCSWTNNKIVP
jgi:hypothetical protein